MKVIQLSIEEIENGYVVNGATYSDQDGTAAEGPVGKPLRTYAKDWDDVGETVAEFIIDNG